MEKKRVLVTTIVLTCCLNLSAITYYVDQTTGDDDNSGTAQSSPWKNSPGMVAYSGSGTLQPGDTVYFDNSDTWLVTGTQGLYLVGGVTYIGDSWGSGSRAVIKANGDLEAGVVRFRDHPTFETIFKGFNVDANSKVTTGIDINHRWASLMNGATKRVENSEVHHIWSRKSLGQFKYGIIISNHGGSAFYTENVEILNTVVHDISRDGICLYPGDDDAGCRIKNITVRGSEVYNTGQDPDYGGGAGIVVKGYIQDAYIEYNYVHDTNAAGIYISGNETNHYGVGPNNIHIRNNILTNDNDIGAIQVTKDEPKEIKIYGNIVYNSQTGGGFNISKLTNTLDLLMYNNTFYNAPVIIKTNSATITRLELKNNILYYPSGTPLVDRDGDITAQSNNLTSNPAFENTADLPTAFSGTYGIDITPNASGLRPQPSSIAIDNGATLSSPFDLSINTIPRPSSTDWDIGAYEVVLGLPGSPPQPPTQLRIKS